MSSGGAFRLCHVASTPDANAICAVHLANVTPFIWPRDEAFFRQRADAHELFAIKRDESWVALCYVKTATENEPREFGGLFVDEKVRGSGLGSTLGSIAVATAYWSESENDKPKPMIAHVHVENDLPRPLLTTIGFTHTGQEIVPEHANPPPSMKRNKDGQLVGDVFTYDHTKLVDVATRIERLNGKTKKGDPFLVEVPAVVKHKERLVQTLRALAAVQA